MNELARLEIPKYVKMDECGYREKTVLLRVDFNSPIEPGSGRILDITRIKSHVPTISYLLKQNAKVVLLSHQGQKGSSDFVSLKAHAEVLSELLRANVKFVEQVYGDKVDEAVRSAKNGDVILLENTRFVEEETRVVNSYEEHAKCELVKRLSAFSHVYVNDAFASSHRNHASLVGFPFVLPAVAGKLMTEELEAVKRIVEESSGPTAFLLGGGKLKDSVKLVNNILERGVADKVVLTGLIANAFLVATGFIRESVLIKKLSEYENELKLAKRIFSRFNEKILLPVDVAVERNGERVELPLEELRFDDEPMDVGSRTITMIHDSLKGFKTAFLRGPAGVVEKRGFEKGTVELLKLLCELGIYTVIGGGHTRIIAEQLGLVDKLGYASTGGGALLTLLSGEPLPALQALSFAFERTKVACGDVNGRD
ncbi:phosphoglycerate kinase [Candidatus Marsarchaeota G2 archaeon ECH_B_SAG-F08]|uniref:Phosphoglycerate kinase n=6 Tax=Candidatus Marsarchaeota TaxID=1978152 RepID=A0A2R6AJ96_9ARCH|nr:MAG: phosphoglycerate kinase [Candidatus Marsarchaeota G1 archaeon OSP_D]PSN86444.1 MAG: phosphoglycerate kinase [Candidatus Marsarchaeota G1 archaeon BE_D]PSN99724.1 MAG: phosphoglycerate kinase [Candidatus Marsarchaeota G2 archaeon ECH_B_SAG-F08]PSO05829.1 MAG: phosphoglycerate kinase [Candidatus Marsarchaeota G2 archaeon ECH_B_SAG-G16]